MPTPDPMVRRSVITALIGVATGIAVGIVALYAAMISSGAGHGAYVAARALFPFSMLLTLVEGAIGPLSIGVALLQFPLYGACIGWMTARSRWRGVAILVGAHLAAALLCFSGLIPNFS